MATRHPSSVRTSPRPPPGCFCRGCENNGVLRKSWKVTFSRSLFVSDRSFVWPVQKKIGLVCTLINHPPQIEGKPPWRWLVVITAPRTFLGGGRALNFRVARVLKKKRKVTLSLPTHPSTHPQGVVHPVDRGARISLDLLPFSKKIRLATSWCREWVLL